ncbi:hypothetical protein Goshw_001471 [Gossypium schwendimanii]|uniref:Uncharacterized protein n=1 Tax=Gossypium schwendimanii TaxID=34291 RepID=A0A7J9N7Q8_GOSSC|nr:hypothetical protein [Gossypium schwendimanii]
MWEDRYDYVPIREPIIIPELACMPEYMPLFRIHGKPYLLSTEERQRSAVGDTNTSTVTILSRWLIVPTLTTRYSAGGTRIPAEVTITPAGRDDDAGPSTRPRHSPDPSSAAIQSPGPVRAPTQSPNPAVQPMTQSFQMMPGWSPWPGSSSFFIAPSGQPMYRSASPEGSQEG